jgi:hypothetical protein
MSVPSSSQSKASTFRTPVTNTGLAASGFPGAGAPSVVSRRIFPFGDPGSCADVGFPASPVPTYSIPSGPNRIRPPSWNRCAAMSSRRTRSSLAVRPSEASAYRASLFTERPPLSPV